MQELTGYDLVVLMRNDGITPDHIGEELKHRFRHSSGCYDNRLAGYTPQQLLDAGLSWPGKDGWYYKDPMDLEFFRYMLLIPYHYFETINKTLQQTYGASLDAILKNTIERTYIEQVPEDIRYAAEKEVIGRRYNKEYSEGNIPNFSICQIVLNGKNEYYRSYVNLTAYHYALALTQCDLAQLRYGYTGYFSLIAIDELEYTRCCVEEENSSHIKDAVTIDLDNKTMTYSYTPVKEYCWFSCTLNDAAKEARILFNHPKKMDDRHFRRAITQLKKKNADQEQSLEKTEE